jgi:hypothetical protein
MDWLCRFTEATYLLGRFQASHLGPWLRGRRWERWAAQALGQRAWIQQAAGQLRLFGRGSASGFRHELDGAGYRAGSTIIIEAKGYERSGPTKADILVFDRKTFDLFVGRCRRNESGSHWRVLASATSLDDCSRRYCFLYGIVAVEPARLPLPLLLKMASRPSADEFFSHLMLGELVRLGEIAVAPMEKRYVWNSHDELRFDLRALNDTSLDDLLWLQDSMTQDLLDLLDRERPGYFEERAERLTDELGIAAPTGEVLHLHRAQDHASPVSVCSSCI